MADQATFLHITDPHVSAAGVAFERDDRKVDIPGIPNGMREDVLGLLFRRLADLAARDHQDLMAYPFFSLAKSPRTRPIDFRMGKIAIRVEAVGVRKESS